MTLTNWWFFIKQNYRQHDIDKLVIFYKTELQTAWQTGEYFIHKTKLQTAWQTGEYFIHKTELQIAWKPDD